MHEHVQLNHYTVSNQRGEFIPYRFPSLVDCCFVRQPLPDIRKKMDCNECYRRNSRRRRRSRGVQVAFYLAVAVSFQELRGCHADDTQLLTISASSRYNIQEIDQRQQNSYTTYHEQTLQVTSNPQRIGMQRLRRRLGQVIETDDFVNNSDVNTNLQDTGNDQHDMGTYNKTPLTSGGRLLPNTYNNGSEVTQIQNSKTFQIVLGTLLGAIFLVRTVLCGLLIRYRKSCNLQLAQPWVLAALIISGSLSILGCYFLLRKEPPQEDAVTGDAFCLIRVPIILLPLTCAGNILLGRVWRIVLLLTPVLNVDRGRMGHNFEDDTTFGVRSKDFFLQYLTKMADFYCWIQWAKSSLCNVQPTTFRKTSTALRKQVPLQQLFFLTSLLTLPQLLFQILNLSVPAMQEKLAVEEVVLFDDHVAERIICAADTGIWPIYVGISLTFLPYVVTAVIAWNSADDLPKIFNEAAAYTQCFKVILLVVVIIVPPIIMDRGKNPDIDVYFTTMVVFAFSMPPCWFLVYPKLWQAIRDDAQNKEVPSQSSVRQLLRKRPNRLVNHREDNGKSAKLALTIGKMYEDMGMAQKSIDLFDEALAVWECDPGRDHKDKVGGFTVDEINSFSVSDLEFIVQLLIAKGRINGTFQVADNSGQKHAAQAWLDALEIYENAPARAKMLDRSMLFPIFSGLFVFLKGGKIQQDAKSSFEQNLAHKFVRETRLHGDPVHYSRALAMVCEVKARLGKYRVALDTFETLKKIYDPEEHSEGIASAYGTDRSAQAFSQTALWHLQLGDEAKALEACEYVLDELMPVMDPKNVLNMCEMLLPILYVFKIQGQESRMKVLFDKYVIRNFHLYFKGKSTPCEPLFKPMTMLLEICINPNGFTDLPEAVQWLIDENNGVASDFLDSVYTKLCWSTLSLTAELCLRVAKQLIVIGDGDVTETNKLIVKGLKLAEKAERRMTNDQGKVILPIAYALHQPVYSELKELARTNSLSHDNDVHSIQNSSQNSVPSSAVAEAKNLPSSYLNANASPSGTTVDSTTDVVLEVDPKLSSMGHIISTDTDNSSPASVGARERVGGTSRGRLESHDEVLCVDVNHG